MGKPAILCIDDDLDILAGLEARLKQHFGDECQILTLQQSPESCDDLPTYLERKHLESDRQAAESTAELTLEPHSQELERANAELAETLEELQTAEEELQQQNEELMAAQEEIALQVRRYQELFQFAPDGYLVTDLQGIIQEANQAVYTLFNTVENYLIGFPLFKHVAKIDRPAFLNQIARLSRGCPDQTHTFELELQPREGKSFTAAIAATPIYKPDGELSGFRWSMRDITESKQLQLSLEASEAKLTAVLDHVAAAVNRVRVFADRSFEYDYCSAGFARIFGYTPEEVMADTNLWYSRLYPEDRKKVAAAYELTFAAQPASYEYRFYHQDGSLRWIFTTFTSHRDEQHNCWIVTSISTDITERKQLECDRKATELALLQSQENLKFILQNMPVMLDAYDASGQLIIWNSECERVTGYRAEEILGNPNHLELLYPDAEERQQMMEEFHRIGNNFRNWEYRLTCKDGSSKWILWSNVSAQFPIPGWSGWAVGIDISERKQQEADRKAAELALQEAQRFTQMIADTTPAALYIYDLSQQCNLYSNRSILDILGYTIDQIRTFGRELLPQLIHPEDIQEVAHHQQAIAAAADGEELELEYRMCHANGSWCWLHSRDRVFKRDAAGDVIQYIGAAQDITKRKNTELALQESEELRRLALEFGQIGTWNLDLSTQQGEWNDQHFRIMGFAPGEVEVSYHLWRDRVHPDDLERVEQAILAALDNGLGFQVEYRIIHPDRSLHWVISQGQPLLDAAGEPVRLAGVILDISERKRQEADRKTAELALQQLNQELEQRVQSRTAALQQSEAMFRQLAENISEVFFISSADLRQVIYVSPAYAEIWGRSLLSLYQQPQSVVESLHPDDRDRVLAALYHQATGEPFCQEYRIIRPDGTLRWIFARATPIFDETGQLLRHVGIAEDISDRKQTEQKLRDSQDFFDGIINVITDPIFVKDEQHRWVFANPAFGQFLGVPIAEFMGQSDYDYFPAEQAKSFWENDDRVLTTGVEQFTEEQANHATQGLRVVATKKTRFQDSAGNRFVVGYSRDITEQKHFQLQLETSLREKEVLLKEVHHRVKNNLEVVSSLLLLQAETTDDAQAIKLLQESQQRVEAIALVHELLHQSPSLERIELSQYVQTLVQQIFSSCATKPIEYHLAVEPISLNLETALPCGLILNELVTNALKHAFPGTRTGWIAVDLRQVNNEYILTVSDDGVGWSENVDLYQVPSLGLQLIRDLVRQLHGTLEINPLGVGDEAGQGRSCFRISFQELTYRRRI